MSVEKPPNNHELQHWQRMCQGAELLLSCTAGEEAYGTRKKLETQTQYHRMKFLWNKIRASTFVAEADQLIIKEALSFIHNHPKFKAKSPRPISHSSTGRAVPLNFTF
jgi:hypothetical protein